jgi:hypothetical protein
MAWLLPLVMKAVSLGGVSRLIAHWLLGCIALFV